MPARKLVIYFRKPGGVHDPNSITNSEMENVERFKFLGINISNDLSWTNKIEAKAKKTHQCSASLGYL